MRYDAYITVYDVFDQVHITYRVWRAGDTKEDRHVDVLNHTVTVAGTGRTEPSAWLLDALVAAAETL